MPSRHNTRPNWSKQKPETTIYSPPKIQQHPLFTAESPGKRKENKERKRKELGDEPVYGQAAKDS
jgi:hypothetical protein